MDVPKLYLVRVVQGTGDGNNLPEGRPMRYLIAASLLLLPLTALAEGSGGARYVETPYKEPRVVFDFYFDHPQKIGAALYWIRSLMNPLTESPYDMAPEFMDIVVVIHGTEIVTVARKNYARYKDSVERMRYYASLGVKFKVCSLAAQDYGYKPEDFYAFVDVAAQ